MLCGYCLGCSFCSEREETLSEKRERTRREDTALRVQGLPTLRVKMREFFRLSPGRLAT